MYLVATAILILAAVVIVDTDHNDSSACIFNPNACAETNPIDPNSVTYCCSLLNIAENYNTNTNTELASLYDNIRDIMLVAVFIFVFPFVVICCFVIMTSGNVREPDALAFVFAIIFFVTIFLSFAIVGLLDQNNTSDGFESIGDNHCFNAEEYGDTNFAQYTDNVMGFAATVGVLSIFGMIASCVEHRAAGLISGFTFLFLLFLCGYSWANYDKFNAFYDNRSEYACYMPRPSPSRAPTLPTASPTNSPTTHQLPTMYPAGMTNYECYDSEKLCPLYLTLFGIFISFLANLYFITHHVKVRKERIDSDVFVADPSPSPSPVAVAVAAVAGESESDSDSERKSVSRGEVILWVIWAYQLMSLIITLIVNWYEVTQSSSTLGIWGGYQCYCKVFIVSANFKEIVCFICIWSYRRYQGGEWHLEYHWRLVPYMFCIGIVMLHYVPLITHIVPGVFIFFWVSFGLPSAVAGLVLLFYGFAKVFKKTDREKFKSDSSLYLVAFASAVIVIGLMLVAEGMIIFYDDPSLYWHALRTILLERTLKKYFGHLGNDMKTVWNFLVAMTYYN